MVRLTCFSLWFPSRWLRKLRQDRAHSRTKRSWLRESGLYGHLFYEQSLRTMKPYSLWGWFHVLFFIPDEPKMLVSTENLPAATGDAGNFYCQTDCRSACSRTPPWLIILGRQVFINFNGPWKMNHWLLISFATVLKFVFSGLQTLVGWKRWNDSDAPPPCHWPTQSS